MYVSTGGAKFFEDIAQAFNRYTQLILVVIYGDLAYSVQHISLFKIADVRSPNTRRYTTHKIIINKSLSRYQCVADLQINPSASIVYYTQSTSVRLRKHSLL